MGPISPEISPKATKWPRAEKILASASDTPKDVATFLEAFVKKHQKK